MMEEPFPIIVHRLTVIRRKLKLPVSPCRELSVPPYREMSRRQFDYSLIDCSRTGHILERKELGNGLEIHLYLVPIDRQKTFQFRPEIEISPILPIVERFDPESISRKQEFLLAHIPNGNRKHASQMRDIIFTKVFIQVDNTLGIRVGGQDMPSFHELLTEFPIIVDLAIEDDSHRTILVVDRLTPGVDINDRQTSHTQPDLTIEVKSLVIRSTSANEGTHASDQRLINLSWL